MATHAPLARVTSADLKTVADRSVSELLVEAFQDAIAAENDPSKTDPSFFLLCVAAVRGRTGGLRDAALCVCLEWLYERSGRRPPRKASVGSMDLDTYVDDLFLRFSPSFKEFGELDRVVFDGEADKEWIEYYAAVEVGATGLPASTEEYSGDVDERPALFKHYYNTRIRIHYRFALASADALEAGAPGVRYPLTPWGMPYDYFTVKVAVMNPLEGRGKGGVDAFFLQAVTRVGTSARVEGWEPGAPAPRVPENARGDFPFRNFDALDLTQPSQTSDAGADVDMSPSQGEESALLEYVAQAPRPKKTAYLVSPGARAAALDAISSSQDTTELNANKETFEAMQRVVVQTASTPTPVSKAALLANLTKESKGLAQPSSSAATSAAAAAAVMGAYDTEYTNQYQLPILLKPYANEVAILVGYNPNPPLDQLNNAIQAVAKKHGLDKRTGTALTAVQVFSSRAGPGMTRDVLEALTRRVVDLAATPDVRANVVFATRANLARFGRIEGDDDDENDGFEFQLADRPWYLAALFRRLRQQRDLDNYLNTEPDMFLESFLDGHLAIAARRDTDEVVGFVTWDETVVATATATAAQSSVVPIITLLFVFEQHGGIGRKLVEGLRAAYPSAPYVAVVGPYVSALGFYATMSVRTVAAGYKKVLSPTKRIGYEVMAHGQPTEYTPSKRPERPKRAMKMYQTHHLLHSGNAREGPDGKIVFRKPDGTDVVAEFASMLRVSVEQLNVWVKNGQFFGGWSDASASKELKYVLATKLRENVFVVARTNLKNIEGRGGGTILVDALSRWLDVKALAQTSRGDTTRLNFTIMYRTPLTKEQQDAALIAAKKERRKETGRRARSSAAAAPAPVPPPAMVEGERAAVVPPPFTLEAALAPAQAPATAPSSPASTVIGDDGEE